MTESSRIFDVLKEKIEKKPRLIYCYKCSREVRPRVKLFPTLLGEIVAEYLCPIHNIVLLSETIKRLNLPNRNPSLIVGGAYIAFEGIDGSGKTYHAKWLVSELGKYGYEAIYVVEPYIGAIKEFLYSYDVDADAEVFLFAADRIILQKNVVLPALKENKAVISDRSVYSSIVYQSIRGVSEEYIWGINRSIKIPELVIVLDVPVEEALNRIAKTRQKITRFEDKEILSKAREKFLKLPEKYSELSDFVVINSDRPEEDVKRDILKVVLEFVRKRRDASKD
ncbi:MAG: dTMP kinase [Candidatus Njordarchaeales archaeon]